MVYVLYEYKPSPTAAIIAAGLFGASAIYHLITMIRTRRWFYAAMTVGGFSKPFQMKH